MRKNWVEWLALGVSLLAIAAVVGYLVVDGIAGGGTRAMPQVTLDHERGYATELGYVVPAEVRNAGDAPAERVVLEASAQIDGEREVSSLEIDFLPVESEVEVYFGFHAQPEGEVTVRIVGFQVP